MTPQDTVNKLWEEIENAKINFKTTLALGDGASYEEELQKLCGNIAALTALALVGEERLEESPILTERYQNEQNEGYNVRIEEEQVLADLIEKL